MTIRKMEYSDAVAVSNMLKVSSSIPNDVLVVKDVLSHVNSLDSLSVVLVDDSRIVGVCARHDWFCLFNSACPPHSSERCIWQ